MWLSSASDHCLPPIFTSLVYLQPYPHDQLLSLFVGGVQEVVIRAQMRNPAEATPHTAHLEHFVIFFIFIGP